jgi:predicted amidohydrolase
MAKLTVSLAQMRITAGDVRRNVNLAEKLIQEASQRKSHIVVLPELWSTGYALAEAREHATELNKGLFAQLSTLATQHRICITGSILEKRGLEVANSSPFFASNGRMMGIYRKIHLFGLMEEDKYLQPGSSPVSIDLPWGVTSLAICYDLRFPELFRRYALDQNARLVLVCAEWPLERIAHWRALLIARAIENQVFIVACNAAGESGGTVFGGHSMIVDPWGRVVVEAGEEPQLLTGEFDLDMVDEVRRKLPALSDVRNDVYTEGS